MWSVLSQYQTQKPKADVRSTVHTDTATSTAGETGAVDVAPESSAQRSAQGGSSVAGRPAERAVTTAATLYGESKEHQGGSKPMLNDPSDTRAVAVAQREAAVAIREEAVRAAEESLAAKQAQLEMRDAELRKRAEVLSIREAALADARSTQHKTASVAEPVSNSDHAHAHAEVKDRVAIVSSGAVAADAEELGGATDQAGPPADGAAVDSTDGKHDEQRGKVRRVAATGTARCALTGLASLTQVRFNEPKAAPVPLVPDAKAGAGKAKEPDGREIVCDGTAEWIRTENLTASLVRQRTENPDEVFFPLPNQRTCELTDIFSAPRRRERGKGSGDWTPASVDDTARQVAGMNSGPKDKKQEGQNRLQLLGVDGEYVGEQLALPFPCISTAVAKTILLGRSSSCDVTLSRDDQISRRHMQIEVRDGRLFARDLGST